MNVSKKSFAARIHRAQQLSSYIKDFTGFDPPRTDESAVSYQALTDSISIANQSETALMKDYRLAVNERQNAFFGKSNSVQSLFIPIKDMIKAQYGANSIEVTILESIIRKMRSSKVSRTSSDPTNPEQVKSISQSEKSYGSLTKNFNDFITVISGFESYKPSKDTLKLPSLQEMSEKLAKLNDTVSQKINQLRSVKADRLKMYDELRDRSLRIKSYVKAHYGVDSNEYNMIRLMRF